MEQEIIAERQKGAIAAGIVALIIAAVLCVMVIGVADRIGRYVWIMGGAVLVIDVVLVVMTVRTIVRVSRLPKVIAVREDDVLVFLGERVRFTAIAQIDYRNARGRYGMMSWGKLTIFVNDGRTLRCDYVADVNRVHGRIMQLKYEYTIKELG